jgi:short-subunit dehydrogenase
MPHRGPSARRKTILITGASSGLGAGMARHYAASGHDLALCARRLDRLDTLKAELLARPGIRVEVRALDVNDPDAVSATFDELDAMLEGIDRFIVNAGISNGRPIGQGHLKQNIDIARTNFVGALAQIEAALSVIRRQGAGHLVLVSSVAAVRPLPGSFAAYSASKIALASLGKGLATEYAGTPIKVSIIFPGYIRTPMNEHRSRLPFEVDVTTGVRAIVAAIDKERKAAFAPSWPWSLVALVLARLPASVLKRRFS